MNIPKKISEDIIHQNPWRKILVKKIRNKAWNIDTYSTVSHTWEKFATMVLPITKTGEIIYCKEWRVWIEDFVYNFPFWIKEKRISFEENAKKELLEEVWCITDNMIYLWESISVNYDDTIIKYFLALDCDLWENDLEEWEYIEVIKSNIKEFEEKILSWIINCPITISCYSLAKFKWFID